MLNFFATVLESRPTDSDTSWKELAGVGIGRIPFALGVSALPANLRAERVGQSSAEHVEQGWILRPALLCGSNFTEVVAHSE